MTNVDDGVTECHVKDKNETIIVFMKWLFNITEEACMRV